MEKMDSEHKFCIIVGAGMCGIAVAAHIVKHKVLSYEDFMMIDKNDDYGGVWQANHYPGAACDVVSHAYQMKFHLNPSTCLLRPSLMVRMEQEVCTQRGDSGILSGDGIVLWT